MQKRSRNKPDVNEIVFSMVQAIAEGREVPKTPDGKNPLAVALGRMGGLKGGHARAAKMTAKERSDSARNAARGRWTNREKQK